MSVWWGCYPCVYGSLPRTNTFSYIKGVWITTHPLVRGLLQVANGEFVYRLKQTRVSCLLLDVPRAPFVHR